MKKGLTKILTFVAAFALVLPVFSLCACTDEPRVLNDVEKKLVGKWRQTIWRQGSSIGSSISITFYEDGTYYGEGSSGTFTCDQKLKTDNTFGAYYLVIPEGYPNEFAFSAGYDKLCSVDKDGSDVRFTYGYSDYHYRVDEE